MGIKRNFNQQLPTRWLLAIVAVLLVYGLSQPLLNGRLGWNLPSLAGLLDADAGPGGSRADVDNGTGSVGASGGMRTQSEFGNSTAERSGQKAESLPGSERVVNGEASRAIEQAANDDDLLYGLLRPAADDEQVFVSPSGLRYEPGSQEGHRLKHLERHLKDQPTRPGRHGVFVAAMPQVLSWIDDAFARAEAGQRGVRKRVEGNRAVYEVPFTQVLGYVGGRDGKRDDHPPCKLMRLIVEDGDVFITAFPM